MLDLSRSTLSLAAAIQEQSAELERLAEMVLLSVPNAQKELGTVEIPTSQEDMQKKGRVQPHHKSFFSLLREVF